MTGSAAAGPIFPSPKTAEPSVTTATVFLFMVKRRASAGSAAIACEMRATPGVYARERSSLVFSGTFGFTSIFPPKCRRKVRSLTLRTFNPGFFSISTQISCACFASIVSQVMSTTTSSRVDSATSSAVIAAPAFVIAVVACATGCLSGAPSTRIVIP